jgi:hypothetical protein
MKPSTIRSLAIVIFAMAGALLASAANAYVYSSANQWGSWCSGSWCIYNNGWGYTNYNANQLLNISSIGTWNVSANATGGGVKSYPSTTVVPNTALSSMQSASGYFDQASPSSGAQYNWMFDVYTTSYGSDQIQVYEAWNTPTGGWGSQIYSNVTVGSSTWSQVWQAHYTDSAGHYDNVLMFFRSSQRNSGYEDLLAIMNWCKSKGLLQTSTFYSMSYGFELTYTNGWQSFYLNGYSASWYNKSGGGSGI